MPPRQLRILPQPDDTTCGPTCLEAVYRFYGDPLPLDRVVAEIAPLPGGGTLGVELANHALRRGYRATIYTYNLQVFDPTWFQPARDLAPLLRAQRDRKRDHSKLVLATDAYLRFLAAGGEVRFEELGRSLLARLLTEGPLLTGLSATYLYACPRERGDAYDDIGGVPTGHFVVLTDVDDRDGTVGVADPLHDNPRFGTGRYRVGVERLIGAILLGVVTYDANLVVLRPRAGA
ncbi:MAG: hypothetical protein D6689_19950 [Deltaproteobacteria bacterium]|nr:MAG: hypothetical protein D6689_19950 [Deltaproteobacteria bacterium]